MEPHFKKEGHPTAERMLCYPQGGQG